MDEKKLIDLYKSQLAQSQQQAPEGLWDEIAFNMDQADENQLVHHYKTQLALGTEKAPEGLWEDISRKMDIDEVWGDIAKQLDKDKRTGGFWWFNTRIAAAIAILLLSTVSVWLISNLSSPNAELVVEATEFITPDDERDYGESTNSNRGVPPSEFNNTLAGSNSEGNSNQGVGAIAISPLKSPEDIFREENYLPHNSKEAASVSGTSTLYPLRTNPAILATTAQPYGQKVADIVPEKTEKLTPARLSVEDAGKGMLALGFTTAMKNTWLYNHETFQGFNPNSGTTTRMQIYPDIAVSLRYRFSEHWEMESSLSFSSRSGQNYEQYIFGRYSQREISLNYFHAEILAAYKHRNRWLIHSVSHSTSLGLYYGLLNSASETIAGMKEDISGVYRGDDYGIIGGHYLNIPITGRLLFSPGIHFTLGLPNIYQGAYTFPSLKRTHNSSVELRLSLYYNFSR